VAEVYTLKLHHQTPKKGLHVGNGSKKAGPLRAVEGESEGLRRKELLE